jgi:hypothetical protein
MPTVEFTRRADRPVGDQLADMRRWLDDSGIRATDLQARILHGSVTFTATFQHPADAERFVKEFAES